MNERKLNWETAPYSKKGKAAFADFMGMRYYVKWTIGGFAASINGNHLARLKTMEEAQKYLQDRADFNAIITPEKPR